MNQFGEESHIPYLNIEEGDVGVLIAFPIVGLFVAGIAGVESLALPFVAGGLGLGVAIVYVSPTHVNAWTWTKDVSRYAMRPQITFSAPSTLTRVPPKQTGMQAASQTTRRLHLTSGPKTSRISNGRGQVLGRSNVPTGDGGVHRDRPGQHGLRDVR